MKMQVTSLDAGTEISEDLKPVLLLLGRGLGIISVYGKDHPAVDLIIDKSFDAFQQTLQQKKTVSIGTFHGTLTINEEPVIARDMPIRTLEKRLSAMKISHMTLSGGLPRSELKEFLLVLCAPSDDEMKVLFASAELPHIKMEDVKYVALRDGEIKASKNSVYSGGNVDADAAQNQSSQQIEQIIALLKSDPGDVVSPDVKQMLSDPEKLGGTILEAAAVCQKTALLEESGSLTDIVIGCLRRTYDGMREESEFKSARGKATLAKTMLLLEKSVLDRVRNSMGTQEPDLDRRIMDGIREMEVERQFDMLSTHYTEQRGKQAKVEKRLVEFIQKNGIEKAREQLAVSGLSFQDQQRLIMQSSGALPNGSEKDMHIIATVLERLDGLMQINNAEQAQASVDEARRGINAYSIQIESQIKEIENQLQQGEKSPKRRNKLLMEISKLTLSLMQPLTVINGSIEAALMTANEALHKELLNMAHQSGLCMFDMTSRMIALVGYPELSEADSHLNEWRELA
ncbi:MAG: hypothetical protein PHP93_00975 [Kiritimatiellales bacterium]|nr:hypothetical protein [Kiritimatiellales bacterium]